MKRYHFIGIGGIGMSALARIAQSRGALVQGSDSALSTVTEELERIGVKVYPQNGELELEKGVSVVYGSAIKSHHPEYVKAMTSELPLLHRSELLAELMEGYDSLLVTGTHGKTTTSTLLTHVLREANMDPTFALGGISLNYSTNGLQGQGRFFVAEADESDGTFLRYRGFGGIITNLEKEHLDFWKSSEALMRGFQTFASQISTYLWWCGDDPLLKKLQLVGKSYGFAPSSDLQIVQWKQQKWSLTFDLQMGKTSYSHIEIPLIGKHNVLNAAAVFGLALQLGIHEGALRSAFRTFKGVKRRMEKKGEKRGVVVLDDYAHHPTEIRTTLEGLREAIGEKRMVALFQPHRFSRLKDCWDGFLEAFGASDALFVTDVYSAGESPLENITAENFALEIQKKIPTAVYFAKADDLLSQVGEYVRPQDVVITIGAGDITEFGPEILKYPLKPFRMAIIQGGKSAEHEVSRLSAQVILASLNREFYEVQKWTISKEGHWDLEGTQVPLSEIAAQLLKADIAFPILHGPFGEDGMIQGFLETLGIPYVGCDFRACVVTMNKAWTKRLAMTHGVLVARFLEFSLQEWLNDRDKVQETILSEFQFPFYIKALHLGSTFGVHRVKTKGEISLAIENISALDYAFLVEEEIIGRELEFGFVGTRVSDAAEVFRAGEIHTYENKYSTTGLPTVPKAALSPELLQKGRQIAQTVYHAVGCSGLARIDFFLDLNNRWILNEVNPMPGCTPMSAYPAIWKAEGVSLTVLLDDIITASLHRSRFHQKHLRPPLAPPVEL